MNRTLLTAWAVAGAVAACAGTAQAGITWSTSTKVNIDSTTTWTWTVDVTDPDAIASLHVTGKTMSDTYWIAEPFESHPDGWSWAGKKDGGDYSWKRDDGKNQTGKMKFSIRLGVSEKDSKAAEKVEVDFYEPGSTTPTWVTVTPPKTPTKDNWVYTPVPAGPSALAFAGAALVGMRRSRK